MKTSCQMALEARTQKRFYRRSFRGVIHFCPKTFSPLLKLPKELFRSQKWAFFKAKIRPFLEVFFPVCWPYILTLVTLSCILSSFASTQSIEIVDEYATNMPRYHGGRLQGRDLWCAQFKTWVKQFRPSKLYTVRGIHKVGAI